jgi:hypothetical protein
MSFILLLGEHFATSVILALFFNFFLEGSLFFLNTVLLLLKLVNFFLLFLGDFFAPLTKNDPVDGIFAFGKSHRHILHHFPRLGYIVLIVDFKLLN